MITRERPDALLPTLGGQTGLNVAVPVAEDGVLDKYKVGLLGAKLETIRNGRIGTLFKNRWIGPTCRCRGPDWLY